MKFCLKDVYNYDNQLNKDIISNLNLTKQYDNQYMNTSQFINLKWIPKLIYKTGEWEFNEIPQQIHNNLQQLQAQNPSYQIFYFSKTDRIIFVQKYFPDFLNDYMTVIPGAYQADLFRYMILYQFGGIYSDIGQEFQVSMDDLIRNQEFVIAMQNYHNKQHSYFVNGFIATHRENPLIKSTLNQSMKNVHERLYGKNKFSICGPDVITQIIVNQLNLTQKLNFGSQNINQNKFYFLDFQDQYIYNENHQLIIQSKFSNYNQIVYPDFKQNKYGYLWLNRRVYKEQ